MDTPPTDLRRVRIEPPPWLPEPIASAQVRAQTTVGLFLMQTERLGRRWMVHELTEGTWEAASWNDMRDRATHIACALVTAGVAPGDRVMLLSEDRVAQLASQLAVQMAGGVTVLLDPGVEAGVAQAAAQTTGASLAIASGEVAASKLHLPRLLGRIGRIDGEVSRWARARPERIAYDEVIRRLRCLDPDHDAAIVSASPLGGVRGISHRDIVGTANRCVAGVGIRDSDSLLSLTPSPHVLQRTLGSAIAMAAGAPLWLWPGLEPSAALSNVGPTVILGVPQVIEELWEEACRDIARRSRVRQAALWWALGPGRELLYNTPLGSRWRRARLARHVLGPPWMRTGGSRLHLIVSGGGPLPADAEAFFRRVGIPVSVGCLELPSKARPAADPDGR